MELSDECVRLSRYAEKLAIQHRHFYYQHAGPWELFARFSTHAKWNYEVSKQFLRLSVQLERCANGEGTEAQCQKVIDKFEQYNHVTAEMMRH